MRERSFGGPSFQFVKCIRRNLSFGLLDEPALPLVRHRFPLPPFFPRVFAHTERARGFIHKGPPIDFGHRQLLPDNLSDRQGHSGKLSKRLKLLDFTDGHG
jgi:hypothetical protein